MGKENFLKTPYGIFRSMELTFAIGGAVSTEETKYCGDTFQIRFFEFVCISSLIYIAIFFIILFFRLYERLQKYFKIPIFLLVSDLIFTVLYAVSSAFIIINIIICPELTAARSVTSVLGILNVVFFFFSTASDFRWVKSDIPPF
ncbi:uncharacterized protein [Centruroides vittatus]|uniref:uncharacterized protein n=1 Tax=Centruroides vittatus TaxID=120091 RepID=UPI00350FD56F